MNTTPDHSFVAQIVLNAASTYAPMHVPVELTTGVREIMDSLEYVEFSQDLEDVFFHLGSSLDEASSSFQTLADVVAFIESRPRPSDADLAHNSLDVLLKEFDSQVMKDHIFIIRRTLPARGTATLPPRS